MAVIYIDTLKLHWLGGHHAAEFTTLRVVHRLCTWVIRVRRYHYVNTRQQHAGSSDETPTETTDTTAETEACIDGNDSGLTDPQNSIPTLEDGRYCEVLVVYMSDDGIMLGDVWNSLALGTCPQELWEELDTDTIAADFPDALVIRLNGPRYFLMQHLDGCPITARSHRA